ncbi:MAG: magnesium chelatase subunit D [Pseudomonadota bacterium]
MSAAAETVSDAQVETPLTIIDLLAIAPASFGGVAVRGLPGPGRDLILDRLAAAMDTPVRVPIGASEDRLLGGLDIATTLQAQRPVYQSGLLEMAHNRLLVLSMAERLSGHFVALVCQAMDAQQLTIEREGRSAIVPCSPIVVALDESLEPDECLAPALADRLAFTLDANLRYLPTSDWAPAELDAARERFASLEITDDTLTTINAAAMSLGIFSLRAAIQTAAAARALAARRASDEVANEDIMLACQLVLAHRVRQLPPCPEADVEPEQPAPEDDAPRDDHQDEGDGVATRLHDQVVEAVTAVLPEHLLKSLADGGLGGGHKGRSPSGKAPQPDRGRPVGVRPVNRLGSQKLNVLATVKAAAPWQRLRASANGRLRVLPEDFRVTRYKPRTRMTTVFVVDASGSSAARRLAEVKGAVELLLAECYVTRARVAVVAFRGDHAEVLLEPTRSLTRARRRLADLPGGGATPLADAIDVTRDLCEQLRRASEKAQVIFLTDGHGNVGRDGVPGHPDATEHALSAAWEYQVLDVPSIVIDTSRRPRDRARRIADALGARYLPLPYADAGALAGAVGGDQSGARS